MTAVGATVLVGFHSIFDFSLQMPAVSVLYAVILGIGIGQSQPSRDSTAMTAVGATVLVGFHSIFDFSLQMPAVSVLYAVILGIGIGQSQPSRDSTATMR